MAVKLSWVTGNDMGNYALYHPRGGGELHVPSVSPFTADTSFLPKEVFPVNSCTFL